MDPDLRIGTKRRGQRFGRSGNARVRIGPVVVDAVTEACFVDRIRGAWGDGQGGFVATVNVDLLRSATRDPGLADLINQASLVSADGMPLVWAARIAGLDVPERVAGSSLVGVLSAAAAEDGRTVFLLGGAEGVPEAACAALGERFPNMRVVGAHSPPFGFDETEAGMLDVVRRVVEAKPDLVFVGLGFPKQELTILRLREELPDAWYVGCGAGIPMAAGVVRRAPQWVQRVGLEWLFRLALEPRRLARRYLRNDLLFAVGLLLSAAGQRVANAGRRPGLRTSAEPLGPGYVCFSGQDWWYHNQAHSDFQLMRRIAERRSVLVVNSIGLRVPVPGRHTQVTRRILRKARSILKLVRRPVPDLPGFYVMSPVPFPFYGSERRRRFGAFVVRAQVSFVARALGIVQPVIIATLPTAWDVVRPMARRSLVYNRSDLHSESADSDREMLRGLERALFESADHVLYVSRSLLADEKQYTRNRAYFLDHGVDVDLFRRAGEAELPEDVRRVPGPRLGFFGALDGDLVDFELLERLAREIPEASLVLIGDVTSPINRLANLPNVHVLGGRPYTEIAAYGSAFDVALMPWVDSPWIRSCNPIKLKEYLALGLPVVSTGFAEVEHYREVVRIADGHDAFVELVRDTLADGGCGTPDERRRRVLEYSWTSRADRVIELVERP